MVDTKRRDLAKRIRNVTINRAYTGRDEAETETEHPGMSANNKVSGRQGM